mgnify:CR=1 FL=1
MILEVKMGFKYYEQNQLMIPMEWKILIDKDDVVFVLNDLIDNMNIDKLLETYSPLGSNSYNPKMMLKILMYGYIRKRYSSRLIAEAVESDIKFIWLAGGNKPTRNVINSFRKDKMKIIIEDVFIELLVVLEKKGYINTEEYFVDGTKIEANANKYTFVWKKAVEKYRAKLQEKVHELMKDIDSLNDEEDKFYPDKEIKPEEITSEELEEFSKRLSDKLNEGLEKQKSKDEKKKEQKIKKIVNKINKDFKPRLEKYNKDLEIMGENRNSYSKTDHDATFMHMKEDHMRNGQLKPGYNIQVGSCNGFVVNWSTHQNRNDNGTLIPHYERYQRFFGKLPDSTGADSGYGNQENYEFLKKNHIQNYIKYPLFHKEQTKKFKLMKYNWQNMIYDEINDNFICPEGKKLEYIKTREDKTETGFVQKSRVYECSECDSCPHKIECTKSEGNRQIRFNKKLWQLKQEAKRNLMSKKGIEMRAKRAEYSEGIFGQIKWNMSFKRFLLRGLENVDLEWGILCFALNIKRMNKKDIEKNKEIAKAKSISLLENITKFYTQKFQRFLTGIFAFGFLF